MNNILGDFLNFADLNNILNANMGLITVIGIIVAIVVGCYAIKHYYLDKKKGTRMKEPNNDSSKRNEGSANASINETNVKNSDLGDVIAGNNNKIDKTEHHYYEESVKDSNSIKNKLFWKKYRNTEDIVFLLKKDIDKSLKIYNQINSFENLKELGSLFNSTNKYLNVNSNEYLLLMTLSKVFIHLDDVNKTPPILKQLFENFKTNNCAHETIFYSTDSYSDFFDNIKNDNILKCEKDFYKKNLFEDVDEYSQDIHLLNFDRHINLDKKFRKDFKFYHGYFEINIEPLENLLENILNIITNYKIEDLVWDSDSLYKNYPTIKKNSSTFNKNDKNPDRKGINTHEDGNQKVVIENITINIFPPNSNKKQTLESFAKIENKNKMQEND